MDNNIQTLKQPGAISRRSLTLRVKMLLSFGIVLVITMVLINWAMLFGVPYTLFSGSFQKKRINELRSLSLIADLKKKEFITWLDEQKKAALSLSGDGQLAAAVNELGKRVSGTKGVSLQASDLRAELSKGEIAQMVGQKLLAFTKNYTRFRKVQIADARTGIILAANHEKDLGVSALDFPSFTNALSSGYGISISVEKDPLHKNRAYLILSQSIKSSHPQNSSEKTVGAVSIYIDAIEFEKTLSYAGLGLGETGEVVLVDQSIRILIPLKYPPSDQGAAAVLDFQINARPALQAVRGKEGLISANDYRGEPVLAAFRYLRISPGVGWGMVVKRDQQEIFAPLWRDVTLSALVSLFILVLALVIVWLLTNMLSGPMRHLGAVVRQAGEGDLTVRTQIKTMDDVGDLSQAFNVMVERLERWNEDLNEQVQTRTALLQESGERLKQEITEHKEAEDALKLSESRLIDAQKIAHIGNWEYDLREKTIWWSAELYRIFGLEPSKDGLSYEGFLEKVHPGDREGLEKAIKTQESYRKDYRVIRTNGETRMIHEEARLEKDEKNTVIRMWGTAQDITSRWEIENEVRMHRDHLETLVQERTSDVEDAQKALLNLLEDITEAKNHLEEANEKLKELDRLKSMFIASMSHELRTPLNSIIGFTGIILQGMTGEINAEQKDQLQRVYASAKYLLTLITDIIDISKIEAGKVEIHTEEFDLDGVIKEVISNLRPEMDNKGLGLETSLPIEVKLKTDRKRLFQCILNYLSNAVKFTEKGKIEITANEVDGIMEIKVKDTGIGIKEEDMPKLFESFARLDIPLKTVIPGTGLGLYLTKKLATEVLKGSVSVESTYGEGSTFGLRVPVEMPKIRRKCLQ